MRSTIESTVLAAAWLLVLALTDAVAGQVPAEGGKSWLPRLREWLQRVDAADQYESFVPFRNELLRSFRGEPGPDTPARLLEVGSLEAVVHGLDAAMFQWHAASAKPVDARHLIALTAKFRREGVPLTPLLPYWRLVGKRNGMSPLIAFCLFECQASDAIDWGEARKAAEQLVRTSEEQPQRVGELGQVVYELPCFADGASARTVVDLVQQIVNKHAGANLPLGVRALAIEHRPALERQFEKAVQGAELKAVRDSLQKLLLLVPDDLAALRILELVGGSRERESFAGRYEGLPEAARAAVDSRLRYLGIDLLATPEELAQAMPRDARSPVTLFGIQARADLESAKQHRSAVESGIARLENQIEQLKQEIERLRQARARAQHDYQRTRLDGDIKRAEQELQRANTDLTGARQQRDPAEIAVQAAERHLVELADKQRAFRLQP